MRVVRSLRIGTGTNTKNNFEHSATAAQDRRQERENYLSFWLAVKLGQQDEEDDDPEVRTY
jgi:hypothetical protein